MSTWHGRTPQQRFDRYVDKTGDCWLWTGTMQRSTGYGLFFLDGQARLTHRVSLSLALGRAIGASSMVCHRCNNRACVRPDHLYEGDALTNAQDRQATGPWRAGNTGKTHCKRGHEFTDDNTYRAPDGRRACRTCLRAKDRARGKRRVA